LSCTAREHKALLEAIVGVREYLFLKGGEPGIKQAAKSSKYLFEVRLVPLVSL
jgi:hypothetical protein